MITKELMNLIDNKKLVEAKELVNTILLGKVDVMLDEKRREYALDLFSEAKKAKVTNKDDDGEGMDPVGHGDDDIDNDGDSDSSDKYLKNRRKVIGKAIKKEEREIPEVLEAIAKVAKHKFGIARTAFDTKDPSDKSRVKQQFYKKKERDEKQKDADRKRKERERAATASDTRVGEVER